MTLATLDLAGLAATAGRSALVYVAIVVALRFAGKRHMAQLSVVDFVLVLLVANAVQNAMVGDDTSLLGGLTAAAVLVAVNVVATRLVLSRPRLGGLIEGEPTLLVRDGRALAGHLTREGVREAELLAAVREHGYADLTEVRQAVLEADGSISVVPFGPHPEERRLPPIRRRSVRRPGP